MRFSDYEQLRFERRNNGVLLITLGGRDKYNAADQQMHPVVARVWADVSAAAHADQGCRVTAPGKAFSAGGDLDTVRPMAWNHRPRYSTYSPR